ncbi:MAG: hypothetical protein JNL10_16285 [Verrucomicrobiales bacterium]|nr:hypothetical protein [Verrucomicrobiales bacterium]
MTSLSPRRSPWLIRVLRSAGWLALLASTALAQNAPGRPEEAGYFDGRLWRVGLQSNGRSTLALDDSGRLYVSGLQLGTTAWVFPSLSRWDGRRWETLATNGGPFNLLLPVGDDLFAGGNFTQIDGQKLLGVARYDGLRWHALGEGVGSRPVSVFSLASYGGQLYVGGQFTNAGALSVTNIVRWDIASETWFPMGVGLSDPVRAISASAEGVFAGAGNRVLRWTGTDWESLGTFGPAGLLPPQVLAIQWHGDSLYAAGIFGSVDGLEVSTLVRWKAGQWSRVTEDPIAGNATSIGFAGENLFLAGAFQITDRPIYTSAKVVSLREGTWTVELNPSSRPPASALCTRGDEVFVLDAPTLRWSQNGTDPVIWHRHGSEWAPISGGEFPPIVTSTVVNAARGVVVGNFSGGGSIPTYPLRHDDSGFRETKGATNESGERVVVDRKWSGSISTAHAPGWWSGHPDSIFIATLNGDLWEQATGPLPIPQTTHLIVSGSRIAIAGYREPLHGEVWEWNGAQWQAVGGRFDPADVPAPVPPSGQNPSRIYSLERHQGRLFAGCAPATIAGQVRSNLVTWDGSQWQNVPGPTAPVHLLRSHGDLLFAGSQTANGPSLVEWDGNVARELADGLSLRTLRGIAVSDEGLIAAVGSPPASPAIPLWFRRGGQWTPPPEWASPDIDGELLGCTWVGNDLYLVGARATISYAESLGLAIWHEPGVRLVAEPGEPGFLALRATGAVSARFAWERADTLGQWLPFQTNALGNPGWIRAATPDPTPAYFRIRALP